MNYTEASSPFSFFMSKRSIYLIIALLITCDILTTYTAKIVLGQRFGEVGLIANLLMRAFGGNWPLAMFLTEFAVFGITTYFFARSNSSMKMLKWRLPMAYLPALTLLTLVANNSVVIMAFAKL